MISSQSSKVAGSLASCSCSCTRTLHSRHVAGSAKKHFTAELQDIKTNNEMAATNLEQGTKATEASHTATHNERVSQPPNPPSPVVVSMHRPALTSHHNL